MLSYPQGSTCQNKQEIILLSWLVQHLIQYLIFSSKKPAQILKLLQDVPLPDLPSCNNALDGYCVRVKVDLNKLKRSQCIKLLDTGVTLKRDREDEKGSF